MNSADCDPGTARIRAIEPGEKRRERRGRVARLGLSSENQRGIYSFERSESTSGSEEWIAQTVAR